MHSLLKENFSDCTDLRQAKLGEAFRALPAEEQRRHALHVIERAFEREPRRKLLQFSILTDRRNPPDIEYHRRRKTEWKVSFVDREAAIEWILKAYALGFTIFIGGGSMGHPCEGEP